MEQRRLRSAAGADNERARLLSTWALVGLTLLISGTLILVFPRQTLIEQVQRQSGSDALTLSYLSSLVRTEPDNRELRLLLAEKKLALGEAAQARAALEPLLATQDQEILRRALRLQMRLLEAEALALPAGGDARRAAEQAMVDALHALAAHATDARELIDLARDARALGERDLARALYARIADSGAALPPAWLEEAERSALADGDYREAAHFLFALQARATSLESRRRYFLRALGVLRSGNLLGEALAQADEHAGTLARDEETLLYLARLALAANDPQRAARYMRDLLHLSRGGDWLVRLAQFAPVWIGEAQASDEDQPQPAPAGMRPYDPELYRLAYDIFLASRHLEDAYKVADAAVRQVPADLQWRERLAQVAEWTAKPDTALKQWVVLAQRSGSDAALQAILRLAPGLNDDEALLYAWKQVAARRTLTPAQWRKLADIYERLGRPLEAVQFLQEHMGRADAGLRLELVARLEERAGRIDAAISHYRELIRSDGSSTARATHLASLYLLKADFAQAYAVLDAQRARAGRDDDEFWRLFADLAWQLQHDDAAIQAYRITTARKDAQAGDAERLVQLVRARAPEEAAALAQSLYARLRHPGLLLAAAEIYTQLRDTAALQRLYSGMKPEDEAQLGSNAYFFSLRAQYRRETGDASQAIADAERALALEPDRVDLRTGLLWLLIDFGRKEDLRRRLRQWQRDAPTQAAYWASYAAAEMQLGNARAALAWFARELGAKRDDYLWLLNYAEALEQAGEANMAWRVRRHAWEQARRDAPAAEPAAIPDKLLAYARLATRLAPGDQALAALRRLLREDQPPAQREDPAVRELVLSWFLSTEQNEAARLWLWRRYGRELAQPHWAEIALALAERDRAALERLLAHAADRMTAENRIDAAETLRATRLAQSYAYEAQEQRRDDDALHLRLSTHLLASASSIYARTAQFRRGALKGAESIAGVNLWHTPRLRLSLDYSALHQESADTQALTGVPARDRQTTLSALWRQDRGETTVAYAERTALARVDALRLEHKQRVAEDLSASLGWARHERSLETLPLALGGHRDRVHAGVDFALTRRDSLRADIWSSDYHTQAGHFLGSGKGIDYEFAHRLRLEYPDLSLRYWGSVQHYAAAGQADAMSARFTGDGSIPPAAFFLPQSFRLQGINLSAGTSVRDTYSRALRPYADVGRSVNSLSGNGYNWLVGISGSVFGADSLSLYLTRARGGSGVNIEVKEFGLRYQYFFDRY